MPSKPKKKVTLELVYAKLLQHDRTFVTRDQMKGHFAEIARQFFRLEDSLAAQIAAVVERVRQVERSLDKQTADIDALRQEYYMLLQTARRIEETLKGIDKRVGETERDLREVFSCLERVETRLKALESPALR
jgi:chromosome segregation ATPase